MGLMYADRTENATPCTRGLQCTPPPGFQMLVRVQVPVPYINPTQEASHFTYKFIYKITSSKRPLDNIIDDTFTLRPQFRWFGGWERSQALLESQIGSFRWLFVELRSLEVEIHVFPLRMLGKKVSLLRESPCLKWIVSTKLTFGILEEVQKALDINKESAHQTATTIFGPGSAVDQGITAILEIP